MNWTQKALKSWVSFEDKDKNVSPNKVSSISKHQHVFGTAIQDLVKDSSSKDYQTVKKAYFMQASPSPSHSHSVDTAISLPQTFESAAALTPTIEHDLNYTRVRTFSVDSQNSVEEELSVLRRKVEEQECTMESLRLSMISMKEETTCHKQKVELIEKRFHGHRVLIDRTLQQTQLALQDQQEILCRQEVLVQKLERERKFKGGVFMESFYILIGMYVIQTPLVKYTIQLISMRFDKHGQNKRWLSRFLQVVFFVHFVKLCKTVDTYFGFTSGIWSLLSWTGHSLRELVTKCVSYKPYNSISYSSAALQDWTKQKLPSDIGLNNLGSQRTILNENETDISSAKSLNIC